MRWLLKTDVRLNACFVLDIQNNSGISGDSNKVEAHPPCCEPGPASGSGPDEDIDGDFFSDSSPHVVHDEAVPGRRAGGLETPVPRSCTLRQPLGTSAEPPPPGPISKKFAAQALLEMKAMIHVMQR